MVEIKPYKSPIMYPGTLDNSILNVHSKQERMEEIRVLSEAVVTV